MKRLKIIPLTIVPLLLLHGCYYGPYSKEELEMAVLQSGGHSTDSDEEQRNEL
ncbi:TPA: hypothetical protein L3N15_004171 [Vibrio parahaemolyticus]|nr:hypothetical protein [Vibrio parahaemolyticus]